MQTRFYLPHLNKAIRQVRKATECAATFTPGKGYRRDLSWIDWNRIRVDQDGRDIYCRGELIVSYPDLVAHDFDMAGADAVRARFRSEGYLSWATFNECEPSEADLPVGTISL